eukprot:TRINITY_DN13163_c0_g1_i1.p1 TRINITY_DN13163_c0_g1~~TRINITY_DN13163_c0_g1_i1.p1  ORF type:complete len:157 (-),score=64.94 TRINITY_DN13163_c0_g1_i1:119-589(-)
MIRRPPRSTLSSSSAASDVYKRQCIKFQSVYKIAVGQVLLCITVLCMLRQDYADLLKLTAAINDENFDFGWKNEVNVWGGGLVTEEQLENLSTLLRKASLGINKNTAISQHQSVALWYLEVFVLTIVTDLSLIHISEPTRLLSISYAVFCLKKKNP